MNQKHHIRNAALISIGSLVIFSVFTFINESSRTLATSNAILKVSSQPEKFKNWGIINDKENNSHIQVNQAWKIEQGNKKIVVAVIDTGIDLGHKDLKQNIWKSPKSVKTSKKEVYGWDFVHKKAEPIDKHGHGTHVAGIIGAIANPNSGTSGVAQEVSIMAIKYYSDGNSGAVNLNNTIDAIHYAIDNGANIINYSGGGPEFSEKEYLAIKRAESEGVLFISAAGNEHSNTDLVENYYYPSAYRLSNIISVAATDINNNLLQSSNWGKNKVDVAAPGAHIYSTLPGNRYGYMSGTSQATAFVTGLAALLLSHNPNLTHQEVKNIILNTVDTFPQLKNRVATGGRINAFKALLALMNKNTFESENSLLANLTQQPGSILKLLTLASY